MKADMKSTIFIYMNASANDMAGLKIKGKIWRVGTGHVVTIPARYMRDGFFKVGDVVEIESLKTETPATSDNSADISHQLELLTILEEPIAM